MTAMPVQLGSEGFDPTRAGGKAGQLDALVRAGFRVPPGFVIDFDEALDAIDDATLANTIAEIGGFPVAVRSSGHLEDLEDASFAGQYETFLGVYGIEELRAKIAACRASAEAERVKVYLAKVGKDPSAAKVSVLVQRMVDAKVAGVAFTLHPITGREEHALVEVCEGLGEKLVSGHVTPSRIELVLETGAVASEVLGDEGVRLDEDERAHLATTLLEIQALRHSPQDVEWAIDRSGILYVLQTRPITRVAYRADVDEFTNADFKDGGISARVCTPLMYSLYRNAVEASFQRYFTGLRLMSASERPKWIGLFYGRGYWNASAVKKALSIVPGFDEEKFDRDLGIQKSYGASGPLKVPTNAKTIARALPVAVALELAYRRQLDVVRDTKRTFPSEYRRWLDAADRVGAASDATFFGELERVYFGLHARIEQAYFTTIYNNSNAQSDFKSFLDKMDAASGRATVVTDLLGGLADVHHMDVQRAILGLYRVAKDGGEEAFVFALAAFVKAHGEHADAELDLTVPRWREAPERVRAMVNSLLASGAPPKDPDDSEREQKRRFETERDAIIAALRKRTILALRYESAFEKQLARVRTYLSAREQMRKFSTQTYAIVRAYTIEAGQRLARLGKIATPDDVFMLEVEEVVALGKGSLEIESRIGYRRKMYDGYRDFVPPNELGRGVEARSEASYADGSALVGLGCSAGIVEGTVRVIATLDEVGELRKGDILVTRFTDPGWTPALGLVSGVITEVGGLLSHAAVIGREYGIPAVLNLPGATKKLKTGQRVRVDGALGRVEVL
jgi:phosphohistidine swiveling domain-containing protein